MSTKPIIGRMDELLKPLGFARHKLTWNRRFDSFVDVITLEKSKSGDTVTISAGVFHLGIHNKCWDTQLPAVIQEPECIVRTRIGGLVDGKDLWWRLDSGRILDDVVEKLNTHLLPFLERMRSFEAMEQVLTNEQVTRHNYPPPIIYLAILRSEQGDRAAACALLTELGKKSVGAWRTRVGEVAGRLGCS